MLACNSRRRDWPVLVFEMAWIVLIYRYLRLATVMACKELDSGARAEVGHRRVEMAGRETTYLILRMAERPMALALTLRVPVMVAGTCDWHRNCWRLGMVRTSGDGWK